MSRSQLRKFIHLTQYLYAIMAFASIFEEPEKALILLAVALEKEIFMEQISRAIGKNAFPNPNQHSFFSRAAAAAHKEVARPVNAFLDVVDAIDRAASDHCFSQVNTN